MATDILLDWQKRCVETVIRDLERRKRGEETLVGTVIVGPPGTGKSYAVDRVVLKIKETFPELNIRVTATTGAAATRLASAKTLASWLCVGGDAMKLHMRDAILKTVKARNPNTIRDTDVLIIDEVSMLSKTQLTNLKEIIEEIREDPQSYGGIYIILIGDPFQLPPVPHDSGPGILRQIKEFSPSCLETQYSDFNYVVANQMKRSEDDPILQNLLLQLISPDQNIRSCAIDIITKQCYRKDLVERPDGITALHNDIGAVILTTAREGEHSVSSYNYAYEQFLKEREEYCEYEVDPMIPIHDEKNTDLIKKVGGKSQLCAEEDALKSRDTFLTETKVATNTPYMLRVNMEIDGMKFTNGDTGCIKKVNEDRSLQFYSYRYKKEVTLTRITLSSEWIPEIGYRGYPIIKASAMTIHKAQGATFHNGIILDTSRSFDDEYLAHKLYTALSRVKKLSDIYLVSFIPGGMLDHPLITKKLQYIWKLKYMKEYLTPK